MKHFSIYAEDTAVYIKEDEDVTKIKDFDSEEAAERFVSQTAEKAINHVNAYFVGESFAKPDKIKDLREALENEPPSKEKAILGKVLGMLDDSGIMAKK